jgi:hypothetical protein
MKSDNGKVKDWKVLFEAAEKRPCSCTTRSRRSSLWIERARGAIGGLLEQDR